MAVFGATTNTIREKMLDLSKELTVFIIDCGNPNYLDCLESLSKQKVTFTLQLIRYTSPLSMAFQYMLDECETKYFVQVDSDFVLYPDAIEYLYNKITKQDDKTAICYCQLFDSHLEQKICGIRIYNHEIVVNYRFNHQHPSCEVEQSQRLQSSGYQLIADDKVLGLHSPKWTHELIYYRYKNIAQKQDFFRTKQGFYNLKQTLTDKLEKSKDKKNLIALMGYLLGKYAKEEFKAEKDYTKQDDKFNQSMTMFNISKSTDKLNVLFLFDVYGWVFYFETYNYKKWSYHNIIPAKFDEITVKDFENIQVLVIPGSCHYKFLQDKGLIKEAKNRGIKIVVQYNSEIELEKQRPVATEADLLVASSPNILRRLKKLGANKTIYLPHNVDTEVFVPRWQYNDFTIGWAGNKVEPVKNYNLLSQLKFPVNVKSDWGEEHFVHGRTLEPMVEFYNSIDIYLCLSRNEGSPYGILESLSCGKVCLGTNTGIIPQVLPKWFIIDQNKDIVAQVNTKLDYLKSLDLETFRQLGESNRVFIEQYFSWWRNVKQLDDLYTKLVNNE